MTVVDLERARQLAHVAIANLEANRRRLDDLNVYPVPDGDTGTNLTLTARAVVETLDRSQARSLEELASELTRAALLGARGNSGVIFSQVVRGFAAGFDGTGASLARAFRSASDAAYRAVREPVEGTMLTLARELAEEAERPHVRDLPDAELLRRLVARGEDAVARTTDLLEALRIAGVVDAGAAGLLEIVRGLAAGAAGEDLPAKAVATEALSPRAIHQALSRYRYCTTFVVEGRELDPGALERELEQLGDSLLVVGDATALKVHVHTDEPGAALAIGTRAGVVEGVEIANMHRQTAQREERLAAEPGHAPPAAVGVVVVAPGEGNRELFESLGASCVIAGGQTMNPSTGDIVAAIAATSASEVIVLPNNGNVLLSAQQAAGLADRPVRVVPARSVQAGLAAMARFLPTASAAENEATMRDALAQIAAGEVTRASRDADVDGIAVRSGDWLGLSGDRAVAAGGEFATVAEAVVADILDGRRELLTLLTGEEEPELTALVERVRERYGVDVEVHHGGQPHYPLLLLAE